jgi:hypothetical protein
MVVGSDNLVKIALKFLVEIELRDASPVPEVDAKPGVKRAGVWVGAFWILVDPLSVNLADQDK